MQALRCRVTIRAGRVATGRYARADLCHHRDLEQLFSGWIQKSHRLTLSGRYNRYILVSNPVSLAGSPMSSVVARCTAACLLAGWQILAAATDLQVQLQDGAGKPLADVVVYAEPEVALAAPRNPATAQIEQKGLKFIPLVSVIQTGTTILFPNNDKVRHH